MAQLLDIRGVSLRSHLSGGVFLHAYTQKEHYHKDESSLA